MVLSIKKKKVQVKSKGPFVVGFDIGSTILPVETTSGMQPVRSKNKPEHHLMNKPLKIDKTCSVTSVIKIYQQGFRRTRFQ